MILDTEGCFREKPPRKKGPSLLKKIEKLRPREMSGLLPSAHSGGSRSWTRHVFSGPGLVQEEEQIKRLHCPSR